MTTEQKAEQAIHKSAIRRALYIVKQQADRTATPEARAKLCEQVKRSQEKRRIKQWLDAS